MIHKKVEDSIEFKVDFIAKEIKISSLIYQNEILNRFVLSDNISISVIYIFFLILI